MPKFPAYVGFVLPKIGRGLEMHFGRETTLIAEFLKPAGIRFDVIADVSGGKTGASFTQENNQHVGEASPS